MPDTYANTFMHNVEKFWNILLGSCGVNTTTFSNNVWPFCDLMYGKVNGFYLVIPSRHLTAQS